MIRDRRMAATGKQLQREFVLRLVSLTKAYRRHATEELERSGLSHTAALLVTLLNEKKGDHSQKFLADHLDIAPASLVPLLRQIEASGLITRHHDPDDKRINNIELTAKGEHLSKEARRVLDSTRAKLFAGIDAEDLEVALRVVDTLSTALATQKARR